MNEKSLKIGKLPAEMLARLLDATECRDPRVIVGPRIGEDAAVIRVGERLLVAKTDPITFATDVIGWYAVHINANDVATMGARPNWFMATVLLPEGAAESLAEQIFEQIASACRGLGVTLVGGHTEITAHLDRPIVVGCMLAEAESEIVTSDGARPGDHLLLTKGIAIEGTAVLAREAAAALRARRIGEETIERARNYIYDPGISVVEEALLACRAAPVHAMHDPTEGGLATAIYELAAAAKVGARIHADAVRVLPETNAFCAALDLDAWGLLASGSLLIAVAPEDGDRVTAALRRANVAAERIGAVAFEEEGVIIDEQGRRRPLPQFQRDELARFFEETGAPTRRL
jgi:hydrogenase expression/formation protein HypE